MLLKLKTGVKDLMVNPLVQGEKRDLFVLSNKITSNQGSMFKNLILLQINKMNQLPGCNIVFDKRLDAIANFIYSATAMIILMY